MAKKKKNSLTKFTLTLDRYNLDFCLVNCRIILLQLAVSDFKSANLESCKAEDILNR